MATDEIIDGDNTNPEEEESEEEETQEEESTEDTKEPDWKAQALKYKAMASRYKERSEKPTELEKVGKQVSINDEVVDLRLDGYSKDEVSFILANGGRKVLDDKNSYVALAIDARREQKKAEEASNKVVDTTGLTDIEKKYTVEQMKAMSTADLKKILPHT